MRTQLKLGLILAVASAFWLCGVASADTLFDFTQESITPGGAAQSLLGQSFTVGPQNLIVTALGAYDAYKMGFYTQGSFTNPGSGVVLDSDPVPVSVPVTLFNSIGTPIASATLTNSNTFEGPSKRLLFTSVAPVTLLANQTYEVVAANNGDYYNTTAGISDSPLITDNGAFSTSGSTPTYLTSSNATAATNILLMADLQASTVQPYIFSGKISGLPTGSSVANPVMLVAESGANGFDTTTQAVPLSVTTNSDGSMSYQSPAINVAAGTTIQDMAVATYNDPDGGSHLMLLAQSGTLAGGQGAFLHPGDPFSQDFPGSFTEQQILDALPTVTSPQVGGNVASALQDFVASDPITLASTFQGDSYSGDAIAYSGMTEIGTFSGATVPEPASLALLGGCALLMLRRRRNTRVESL